jgi:hypothetical protein
MNLPISKYEFLPLYCARHNQRLSENNAVLVLSHQSTLRCSTVFQVSISRMCPSKSVYSINNWNLEIYLNLVQEKAPQIIESNRYDQNKVYIA